MLDQYTIKKKLTSLEIQFSVAFGARTALRVLPELVLNNEGEDSNKDPFWYWDAPQRSRHLLATLRGLQISIAFSLGLRLTGMKVMDYENITNSVVSAAYANPSTATHVMVVGNTCTATAASFCLMSSQAAAQAYDTPPTYTSSIYTQVKNRKIHKAMEKDLNYITQVAPVSITPADLFHRPLWNEGEFPIDLKGKWDLFCSWLDQVEGDFSFWRNWLQDRVNGKTIDLDQLQKQIDLPKEILSKGPEVVNTYLVDL